jgi:hypothetical protein
LLAEGRLAVDIGSVKVKFEDPPIAENVRCWRSMSTAFTGRWQRVTGLERDEHGLGWPGSMFPTLFLPNACLAIPTQCDSGGSTV